MNKRKLKYVKYTKKELDQYVRDKNSCINVVNANSHIGFPPWGFARFQETIINIISRDKVGKFDAAMQGIVLDVRNIKVFGTEYPVRDDDPYNHININANFYIFQPVVGAVIKGVVKHISSGHVTVIIYRVFNVSILFDKGSKYEPLKINQTISFRIKKFSLDDAMPYIEGELVGQPKMAVGTQSRRHLKFEDNDDETANGMDSGISTEETSATKKHIVKRRYSSSSSSSSSGSGSSDSESEDEAKIDVSRVSEHLFVALQKALSNAFCLLQVKIKQEKFSDSEGEAKYRSKKSVDVKVESSSDSSDDEVQHRNKKVADVKVESSSDSSDDEAEYKSKKVTQVKVESSSDSSGDEAKSRTKNVAQVKVESSSDSSDDEANTTKTPISKTIKREKQSSESSSDDSDSNIANGNTSVKVKKEKIVETISLTALSASLFKPKEIKIEPSSDVEGRSFKKPSTDSVRKVTKRKREMSFSEHFDSFLDETLKQYSDTEGKSKRPRLSEIKIESESNAGGDANSSITTPRKSLLKSSENKERAAREGSIKKEHTGGESKRREKRESSVIEKSLRKLEKNLLSNASE